MNSHMREIRVWMVVVLLVLSFASAAFSQAVTGTITGTVRDSTGAVLPGTRVVLVNQDTGLSRTVQSNAAGRYLASSLSLGNYEVTATLEGFQTQIRSGIVLTVGREAVVDLVLSVGAVTQTVEVFGEAALIDTTSATVSGLVAGEQIRELPLNGRSYSDLALLNPGVIYNRTTGSSASDGYGARLNVNGARSNMNLFLVDGTVTNDTSQTAGSVAALSLGVEGIREFRVLTHNFSAEYGRSAGAVVSVVTRSGTNQLHGSAYEFMRNNIFDARDFFTKGELPAFRRNQFGAAVGGPVKKDRIFFFSNYEGLRQRKGLSLVATVPDLDARRGIIPTTAATCASGNGTFNASNGTCAFPVSSASKPYLDLYAPPNGRNFGDGTAQWFVNYSQPINEDYYMERMDFRLSDADNLYVRYIFDPSTRVRPGGDPRWTTLDDATDHYAVLSETHVFSGTAINDFRFGFNRNVRSTALGPTGVDVPPALSFVPGLPMGRFQFSAGTSAANAGGGLVTLGNLNATPIVNAQNLFQTSDSFSLIRGAHSLKFGFDAQRYQHNVVSIGGIRGSWQFTSLAGLIAGQPDRLDTGRVVGNLPDGGYATGQFGWRSTLYGWFVQDDYRVSSRLTLNLGLRHEFLTDPVEVNGLMGYLANLTDPVSTVGVPFHRAKWNFAPRVGMAWDPTGGGKTSVRMGAGIYHNQVDSKEAGPPADYRYSATYSLVCNLTATNPCATFPKAPANPPLSTAKSEGTVDYNLSTPTIVQYGLDVQRQLGSTISVQVGYVGWLGYNLTRNYAANIRVPTIRADGSKFWPTPAPPRINPAFGNISRLSADTEANYNALQSALRKRTGGGLMFQASYTYSKALSMNDSTANRVVDNIGTSYVSLDKDDPGRDYGRAAPDQRHTFVFNSQYQLLALDRLLNSGIAKALLGGWAVNGVWQYGSGLPLNVNAGFNNSRNGDNIFPDRPDLLPGRSNDPTHGVTSGCGLIPAGQKLRTPERWFDPCAFALPAAGTFGNLGRNTMSGPSYNQVNFTVVKSTALTESKKIEFRAEFFNLLNHPSFGLPLIAVFDSTRNHTGTEGSINLTNSEGRQIQLGLKFTF